jgi:hypothetical protein
VVVSKAAFIADSMSLWASGACSGATG